MKSHCSEKTPFGLPGFPGLQGNPGIPGTSGSTLDPQNTLFVATAWDFPYNTPTTFGPPRFTSITSAIAAAVALGPTISNPVEIIVYPGTYTETPDPIQLADFVNITGLIPESVIIVNELRWAPTISLPSIALKNLTIGVFNRSGLVVDTTGAGSLSSATISIFTSIFVGSVSVTFTPTGNDFLLLDDCSIIQRTSLTILSGNALIKDSTIPEVSITGTLAASANVEFSGVTIPNNLNVLLSSIGIYGSTIRTITSANSLVYASGSAFSNITINDGSGTPSTVAVVGCSYNLNSVTLPTIGSGFTFDGNLFIGNVSITGSTTTPTNILVPFSDIYYSVTFEQISGIPGTPSPVVISSVTATSFNAQTYSTTTETYNIYITKLATSVTQIRVTP